MRWSVTTGWRQGRTFECREPACPCIDLPLPSPVRSGRCCSSKMPKPSLSSSEASRHAERDAARTGQSAPPAPVICVRKLLKWSDQPNSPTPWPRNTSSVASARSTSARQRLQRYAASAPDAAALASSSARLLNSFLTSGTMTGCGSGLRAAAVTDGLHRLDAASEPAAGSATCVPEQLPSVVTSARPPRGHDRVPPWKPVLAFPVQRLMTAEVPGAWSRRRQDDRSRFGGRVGRAGSGADPVDRDAADHRGCPDRGAVAGDYTL